MLESLEWLKDHDSESIFLKNCTYSFHKDCPMNEGIQDMEDLIFLWLGHNQDRVSIGESPCLFWGAAPLTQHSPARVMVNMD